jgi:hypothetical protein
MKKISERLQEKFDAGDYIALPNLATLEALNELDARIQALEARPDRGTGGVGSSGDGLGPPPEVLKGGVLFVKDGLAMLRAPDGTVVPLERPDDEPPRSGPDALVSDGDGGMFVVQLRNKRTRGGYSVVQTDREGLVQLLAAVRRALEGTP